MYDNIKKLHKKLIFFFKIIFVDLVSNSWYTSFTQ